MSTRLLAASVFACAAPALAGADLVPFVGLPAFSTEGLAEYSGTVEYTPTGPTTGDLVVTLTNDTAMPLGGFMTGFLFKIVSSDPAAYADFVSSDYPAFEQSGLSAAPFGSDFDGGAAVGGDWEGGGDPSGGVPAGMTGTFTFAVFASDAAFLSAADFINGGANPPGFVARFRGLENGGSDKVPAGATICCIGDVDCDGDIDGRDLGFLLGAWGPALGSSADFDGDGMVGGADLGLLLGNWGLCP